MQLRKTIWMLTALSAMSLVMTGCPEDGETSTTCDPTATVSSCLESEICHPTAKVCVTTCATAGDCPDTAKSECTAVSATNSTKVCKCASNELCNLDQETDLVCSTLDKVCTPKCTTDDACGTGRKCNTTSGQCEAGPTGTDCTYGSCTAANQVCSATTNKCEAAAACTGTAQGNCAYGQFCNAGTCAQPAKPACVNLEGKPATNFAPASGTGYIIYNVEKAEFGGTTGCGTGTQRIVPRVHFYAKDGTLPTTETGLQAGFYVKTSKEEIQLTGANMFGYTRSQDGKSASVQVFLCGENTLNQISLGFYFTGGNGFCAVLTK